MECFVFYVSRQSLSEIHSVMCSQCSLSRSSRMLSNLLSLYMSFAAALRTNCNLLSIVRGEIAYSRDIFVNENYINKNCIFVNENDNENDKYF